MWLLPALAWVSDLATRVYHRHTVAGVQIPRTGPVLLVANHPNSLLDPALVASAAGRPVRFLAKAPLFNNPALSWLVRGAGAVPVYRRADDPALMERNDETFRAAHAALVQGAALGIFPEGISHSEPALAPLKTGAARIALGAARLRGGPFPIHPIGLTFRNKDRFRSEALVLAGKPVPWEDLWAAGEHDVDAVRQLTHRIEQALRTVTVNLEQWEDAPIVECAESIYAVEAGADQSAIERVDRVRGITEALERLRRAGDARWQPLARDIGRHARTLRALGLGPADLQRAPGWADAVRWTLQRFLFALLVLPLAALGFAVLWLPYRATGWAERLAEPAHDVRSTYKALIGTLLFSIWFLLLAGGAAAAWGIGAGFATLFALPPLALVTLAFGEHVCAARRDALRFLLLRRRTALIRDLATYQRELARRLETLWDEVRTKETPSQLRP